MRLAIFVASLIAVSSAFAGDRRSAVELMTVIGGQASATWLDKVPGYMRARISRHYGAELNDPDMLNVCMRRMARHPDSQTKPISDAVPACLAQGKQAGW